MVNNKYSLSEDPEKMEPKLSNTVAAEFGSSDSGESSTSQPDVAPFAGMGKTMVLKHSDTPFWNRFRALCLIVFWIGWFALLGVVIYLTVTHTSCESPVSRKWWQTSSVYQIDPEKFRGSDGNIKSGLKGVVDEMDYLSSLNVETLWLRNTYAQDSNGPLDQSRVKTNIGQIDDMKEVISSAHKSGLKVIVDFVPDYVSINHSWYNKSRYKEKGYENFFVWAPCTAGNMPNNWEDDSGNSLWTQETIGRTDECYLHIHDASKPTLNLRNNIVLDKLDEILHGWLDSGLDGFSLTDVSSLVVDYDFRDNARDRPSMTKNLKANTAVLNRWRRLIDHRSTNKEERVLMGSVDFLNANITDIYYGQDDNSALMLVSDDLLPTKVKKNLNSPNLQALIEETLSVQPNPLWNMCDMEGQLLDLNNMTNVSVSDLLQIITLTLPGSALTCSNDQMSQSLNQFKELGVLRNEDTFKQIRIKFHQNDQILAFTRQYQGLKNFLVAVNFGNEDSDVPGLGKANVEFHTTGVQLQDGTTMKIGDAVEKITLKPGQGVVLSYAYKHVFN